MARLPVVGSDDGTWGDVLNTFLGVAHNSDGTLNTPIVYVAAGTSTGHASSIAAGVALAAAMAALPAQGGIIQLASGYYNITAGQLVFSQKRGIIIRGVGGFTGGTDAASVIEYTGTGSSSIIALDRSTSCAFIDCEIMYNNTGFTGKLLDTTSQSGGQVTHLYCENVLFWGSHGAGQTSRLVLLNQSIECAFQRCGFNGGGYQVYGCVSSASTDFSNIQTFSDCQFFNADIMPIFNPGTGWVFNNPTVQALASGDVGFIAHDAGVLARGLSIVGGGTFDQTTTNTGSWIKFGGYGLSITGMKSSGRQVSLVTFVEIDENGSEGVVISGNAFDNMYRGLDFGATTGHIRGAFFGNAFTNTVVNYLGVAATGGTMPKGIEVTNSSAAVGKPSAFFWDSNVSASALNFDGVHKLYNNGGALISTATLFQSIGDVYAGVTQTAGTRMYGVASGTVGGLIATGSNANVNLYLDPKAASASQLIVNSIATTTTLGTSLRGHVEYPTIISPTQLTANTDDWNPTSLSSAYLIRVNIDAARNLTGIVAQANGSEMWLYNATAFTLTLVHDATSTATNRFFCPNKTNYALLQGSSVKVHYSSTDGRWLVLAGGG